MNPLYFVIPMWLLIVGVIAFVVAPREIGDMIVYDTRRKNKN